MYWVAKCYIAMKKPGDAVPYLEKAVNMEAVDPDDLAVNLHLADSSLSRSTYLQAQRESTKLLAKHSK